MHQHSIGIPALSCGHMCQSWRESYLNSISGKKEDKTKQAKIWAKNVILSCWKFSEEIWTGRNAVMHGSYSTQVSEKEMNQLQKQVKQYYKKFDKDCYIAPASRSHLFNKPRLCQSRSFHKTV
jgi:hypothetical protein